MDKTVDGEQTTIQFEEFAARLEANFDQVEAQGEQIVIERGGTLFALLPKRQRRPRTNHRLTRDDALWDIVGIASSDQPGNTVASGKYTYVANAIASRFEGPAEPQERSGRPQELADGSGQAPPASPGHQ